MAGASEGGEPTARMVAKLPGGGAGEKGRGVERGPNPRCNYALSFAADVIALQANGATREEFSWAHGQCPLPFTCARVSQHHAIPHWPTPTRHPSSALAALLAAETKSILRGFRAAIWQMKSSDDDWGWNTCQPSAQMRDAPSAWGKAAGKLVFSDADSGGSLGAGARANEEPLTSSNIDPSRVSIDKLRVPAAVPLFLE